MSDTPRTDAAASAPSPVDALYIESAKLERELATIKARMSRAGKLGGIASSWKKACAARKNACKPPKPGKKPRGRPRTKAE